MMELFISQRKVWWMVVVVSGRPNLVLAQVQVFGPWSLDLFDLTWDLTWT